MLIGDSWLRIAVLHKNEDQTKCFCFQNKINVYFGYVDPEIFLSIMKWKNFQGVLTDISAETEPLLRHLFVSCKQLFSIFQGIIQNFEGFRDALAYSICVPSRMLSYSSDNSEQQRRLSNQTNSWGD